MSDKIKVKPKKNILVSLENVAHKYIFDPIKAMLLKEMQRPHKSLEHHVTDESEDYHPSISDNCLLSVKLARQPHDSLLYLDTIFFSHNTSVFMSDHIKPLYVNGWSLSGFMV